MAPDVMLPWLPLVAVGSWLATRGAMAYARRSGLWDQPTARSLHAIPTLRGGGVGFVLITLTGLLGMAAMGWMPAPQAVAVAVAGLLVAGVGFLDDHRSVPPLARLVVHLTSGLLVVWGLGPPDRLLLGTQVVWLGPWIGGGLAVVSCVWLINLFNFMDGADGLAGTETVTATAAVAVLSMAGPSAGTGGLVALLLGAAVAGFLPENLPPARVFMGDVGSGFLGLVLGAGVIASQAADLQWLWVWVILLAGFVADATVTLLRRAWRRTAVFDAHREHAYQRAVARWRSHWGVTGLALAINVLWLFPLALGVALQYLNGIVAAVVAYTPLVILVLRYGGPQPPR